MRGTNTWNHPPEPIHCVALNMLYCGKIEKKTRLKKKQKESKVVVVRMWNSFALKCWLFRGNWLIYYSGNGKWAAARQFIPSAYDVRAINFSPTSSLIIIMWMYLRILFQPHKCECVLVRDNQNEEVNCGYNMPIPDHIIMNFSSFFIQAVPINIW